MMEKINFSLIHLFSKGWTSSFIHRYIYTLISTEPFCHRKKMTKTRCKPTASSCTNLCTSCTDLAKMMPEGSREEQRRTSRYLKDLSFHTEMQAKSKAALKRHLNPTYERKRDSWIWWSTWSSEGQDRKGSKVWSLGSKPSYISSSNCHEMNMGSDGLIYAEKKNLILNS